MFARLDAYVGFIIGQAVEQTRQRLYSEAEQLIIDDAVVIPDFWPVEHLLVKPCVKNWPTLSMSVPKYRYLEIDAKE